MLATPFSDYVDSYYAATARPPPRTAPLSGTVATDVCVVGGGIAGCSSALALAERGYGQNKAARQRAADLIGDGYTGFLSGHTHHPELWPSGSGFYANSGSCTSVVEAADTVRGLPPAYLRTQQLSWLEIAAGPGRPFSAQLKSARVQLPGATRLERFAAAGRNPHASAPHAVASWPEGPSWPPRPGRTP